MKKTKLLMPIMAIGATAAVATPFMASCGSTGIIIDGNSLYIPTIAQAQDLEGSTNHNAANELFSKDVKTNPEVFVQDWRYDASWKAKTIKNTQLAQNLPEPAIKLTAKFSDVSCKAYTFKRVVEGVMTDEDWNGSLMSFELDATVSVDAKGSFVSMPSKVDEEGYQVEKLSLHFKAEVTNLPFILEFIVTSAGSIPKSGWRNYFWSAYRTQAPNWQVKLNADGYYNGTLENEYYAFNDEQFIWNDKNDLPLSNDAKATKEGYLWGTYDGLFGAIDYSYHMQNVK